MFDIILLDADGTLFDFERAEREAVGSVLADHGFGNDPAVVARYHDINDSLWKAYERGETDTAALSVERFARLASELHVTCDPEAVNRDYFAALQTRGDLLPGAEEFCRRLAKKARLYLCTNGQSRVQRGRFAASGLAPYFANIFVSEEAPAPKPDPAYYACVSRQIPDFNPRRCAAVGDSLTSDIKGGNAAGLTTVWYDPDGKEPSAAVKPTYTARTYEELYTILTEEGR